MTGRLAVAIAEWVSLGYFVVWNVVHLALSFASGRAIGRDREIRASPLARAFSGLEPPVSLLVPVQDQQATIAAAVRAMLRLDYPTFDVVVVDDGSTDGTLEVLRREFDLVPVPEAYRVSLRTRRIRCVYRSLRHRNLRVVDKDPGGRSDALNAAINVARSPLFCSVDAGAVLHRDSLRRLLRPFLEDPATIASGGTACVANGCQISGGLVEDAGMPRSWIARVQIVEALRMFLLARLGWSPMNAVLALPGAFALFRRTVVIDAGGYAPTAGEDAELVVRLHQLHRAARRPYRIVFVPDPVCWTHAPESLRGLRAHRMRAQRALLEGLAANGALLFHRHGGAAAWLAFPALLLFEGFGPLLELAAFSFMTTALACGWISWQAFAAFTVAAVGMGMLLSASALLLEEMSFHLYRRPRHLAALFAAVAVEYLGYRQLTALWRLRATLGWLARTAGGA